ncbi:protein jim lovell-like [Culicoides brevitarsis]|uniref:protein jim lovell-like n=1 Tax=Culicoides brevitarsis TaxID=469753 RepID=UPI00307CC41D
MDSYPRHIIWNNHDSHMTSSVRELLQNKSLMDISIVCGDKSFHAHKLILSAASPFFHRLIEENPCKHPILILNDYPSWIIEQIITFIYCGEIRIPQEAIFAFCDIARELQIKGLNFVSEVKSPLISPVSNVSSSSQPRRKQPKPHRLSEHENVGTAAPLDFSIKSEKSECVSTSNVSTTIEEPCVKQDNGAKEMCVERRNSVCDTEKETKLSKTMMSDKELLSLPYPSLQSFNAKIPLDGLSPDLKSTKIKEKITSEKLNNTTPYNKDYPFNIQRQHQSARGGPPRSWTNQDLLNALDDVWSKRMNTSQAARYHRIPYNSLLMYVRGKYGKTLNIKLNDSQEQQKMMKIPTPTKTSALLSPSQMMMTQIPQHADIFGDENKLRQLFSQSFPAQGCLPPAELLHNFAVLSKAAAQQNIK